jgi:acyl-CoA synthetase (AMP-forming)/AMP-acid ligase II
VSSLGELSPPAAIHDRAGESDHHDIANRTAVLAGGLVEGGVSIGDVVTWQLPNCGEADLLYRASWMIGAIAAPIHHRAGATEVRELIDRLSPCVQVSESGLALMDSPATRPISDLLSPAAIPLSQAVAVSPAELAVILATSGSTGPPKLVAHSRQSLHRKAGQMVEVHGLSSRDCILMPAPLAHVSGLLNGVLVPSAAGMRVVLMDRWSPTRALSLIETHGVTFMVGPPTFFTGLAEDPGFSPDRVESLRLISTGGAGVTEEFASATARRFGCIVKRTYGSTEAPTIATTPVEIHDDPRAHRTDGLVLAPTEVRVARPGTDHAVGPGTIGELLIRGPDVCAGFFERATDPLLPVTGWLHTGDLGRVDTNGWLTVTGRLKDVIIRGGENIAAAEVEAVLLKHPNVHDAAVVGVQDDRLGERVVAFVLVNDSGPEPRDPSGFDLSACRTWFLDQGVAAYKTPEVLHRLTELPLLPSGKVDRQTLRTIASARHQSLP